MGRRGVAHLPFVVRGSRRPPSVTRERDRKVKGREGKGALKQGYAIIVRSEDQALEYLHLFGIVGSGFPFLGLETNVWAQEAAWRNTCSGWIIGKGGGGGQRLITSHVFLESSKQGYAKHRASRSQLHWICFPKNEKRLRGVKNRLYNGVKETNGTGVFCLWGRETPAFLALGCQVVGSGGRGHTCLVAPSTC
jgi:hypothetical protein